MPLTIDTVAVAVKTATATHHAHAERTLYPRLEGICSYTDYGAILNTFYGYFFPLQHLIAQYISSDDLPDISERRHASLILQDLASIGMPATSPDLCTRLPEISNKAQAFGALYVLEGSTLGGRMISKMLAKKGFVSLNEDHLQFFNGYKEETGSKWKIFLEALNRQTDTDAVIAAANQTFFLFQKWINHSLCYESTIKE